jgi:hypothetical protein
VLASLIESLSGPTLRARVWRGLTQENAVVRTVEQHQAIHQALAAREPELARSWATVHIAGVEDWPSEAPRHPTAVHDRRNTQAQGGFAPDAYRRRPFDFTAPAHLDCAQWEHDVTADGPPTTGSTRRASSVRRTAAYSAYKGQQVDRRPPSRRCRA